MRHEVPRRLVLAVAAGLATTAALAACTASRTAGTAPAVNRGVPTSDATPSGAAMATTQPAGPVRVSEIPVGGGLILDIGGGIAITQPTPGVVKAFTAVCTHQGCFVTEIIAGHIKCPCHGSEFRITDGAVVQGPALRPLPPIPLSVHDGLVTFHTPGA
jgi:Rieske Fe-S protein